MDFENKISTEDKIIVITNSIDENFSESIKRQLEILINELINNDFNALVQILYRVDVDEKKLKQLLQKNKNSNSASIIADLIIKRQLQKIASKEKSNKSINQDDEEKW